MCIAMLCILQGSLVQDTAVYTYTQTHLHDLLVANYTGNEQSTVYHLRGYIEQYGNNK